jgi:hypothetical protein
MTKTFSKVTIKPFVENISNLGLEKYNQVLFDGARYKLELASLEQGGSTRFITGLNPFAQELNKLSDTEKEAKVEQIKAIVLKAEAQLPGGSLIQADDKDWWNKVKVLHPGNTKFWTSSDMLLELDNEPLLLEPSTKIMDLLKYTALKAGGYPEVATSYEDARGRARAPKFYMDELEQTISIQVEVSKLRNLAGAELQKLFEKNTNKLMYICKAIDSSPAQYRKSTPVDVMYQNMDKYINGETSDKDKKKTAQKFLDISKLDMETLKIRALINDAHYFKHIALKGDGMIYEMETATALGKNNEQVTEYLKNPLNEDIFKRMLSKVEQVWNN